MTDWTEDERALAGIVNGGSRFILIKHLVLAHAIIAAGWTRQDITDNNEQALEAAAKQLRHEVGCTMITARLIAERIRIAAGWTRNVMPQDDMPELRDQERVPQSKSVDTDIGMGIPFSAAHK